MVKQVRYPIARCTRSWIEGDHLNMTIEFTSKVLCDTVRRWFSAQRTGELSLPMPAWCMHRYCESSPRERDAWFPAWLRWQLAHAKMPQYITLQDSMTTLQIHNLRVAWKQQWYGLSCANPVTMINATADWR